jgi:hypothetical protein
MLKWYGHAVRMGDNRWPKRIVTWSPGGRKLRRPLEVEKELERVMKQRNLTSDEALNRQLWRLDSSNRRTTGKLIDTLGGGKLRNRMEVVWGNILGSCHYEQ